MTRVFAALVLSGFIVCRGVPVRAQDSMPSAADLALARVLVGKVNPDPKQTIATLEHPMVGMMEQMGVHDPARAQLLVQDAILPILIEHANEIVDLTAKSYALLFSEADLKAIIAFYGTPAGQDLIKAQPAMAATQLQVITAWIGTLRPEIVQRVQTVMKQRGWDHG